jgi:hypothetical protein
MKSKRKKNKKSEKSEKNRKKSEKSEKSKKIHLNFTSLCLASVSALVCEAIDESEELCLARSL